VSAGYGTNNREPSGSALLEGAAGRLGFRTTLSGRSSSELRTPDYRLWNSASAAAGGSATVGYRAAGGGALVATFSQRNERIRLTDEDPAETPLQRIATSRGRVDLTLPLGPSRLEAKVGLERNRRREFEEREAQEVALGLLSKTWTGLLHLHHPAVGRFNGIAGVSGFRTSFAKFGEESLIPNSNSTNAGAFLFEQAETGRFSLSFGARYDYRRLRVADDTELGVTAQTRTWSSLTGNLGVLYHASDPVAVVLNLGRGYRAPSSFDLFANGVHEGTLAFERGNPALRNETSFNSDLALRVQSSTLHLEVGGFANFVSDFIFTVPSGETDPESGLQIFDVTQGDARLTGFELSAQWHPVSAVHFQTVVDYTHGQNTTTDQPLPLIPPFRANYSVRLEGPQRGSLVDPYFQLGGETNGKQARLDPAEAQFYSAAFDGEGYQSEGYTLVHAGAGVGLLAGGSVLRLDLQLRNVFNQRWSSHLNRIKTNARDPGMGRNLVLRVGMDF
jgi:outer membrane receptor protein involved in Fe transport